MSPPHPWRSRDVERHQLGGWWRRILRRVSLGAYKGLEPEAVWRHRLAINRALAPMPDSGAGTVVVAQPKGGVGKSPLAMLITAAMETYTRKTPVLWDCNENAGARWSVGRYDRTVEHLFGEPERGTVLTQEIYTIDKKIDDNIRKNYQGVELRNGFNALIEKPEFSAAKAIVDTIISDFLAKRTDKVHFLYNHFKTTSVQVPTDETFLPVSLDGMGTENSLNADYIVEPSRNELLDVLLPKSLRTKFYSILLDSAAAEQAARMVAMQIATDNAEDLLKELSIQFNKQRQQAITSELLDIVGGSEALKETV